MRGELCGGPGNSLPGNLVSPGLLLILLPGH